MTNGAEMVSDDADAVVAGALVDSEGPGWGRGWSAAVDVEAVAVGTTVMTMASPVDVVSVGVFFLKILPVLHRQTTMTSRSTTAMTGPATQAKLERLLVGAVTVATERADVQTGTHNSAPQSLLFES